MRRFFLLLIFLQLVCTIAFSQESEIYINKIWAFQGNQEFYLPLQFTDSLEIENPAEFLMKQLDSVIVSNNYQQRKRLPQETALNFFDLAIIANISVYNSNHELLTTAKFKRVEYFEDMIDGMFVAVFDATSPLNLQTEEMDLYCMAGNFKHRMQSTKTEEIIKKQWDNKVKKKIYFDQDNLLSIRHYEVKQNSTDKFTLLSLQDPDSFETVSFLLEQKGADFTVLKQLKDGFVMWSFLPVPISVHQKPVLLIETIIPETDFTGYILAVFNGSEYEFHENMKLKF